MFGVRLYRTDAHHLRSMSIKTSAFIRAAVCEMLAVLEA